MAAAQLDIRRMTIIRHTIYVLVAAAVIVPYLLEVPLPFRPSSSSRKLFDVIEQLEPGSHELLSFDYAPDAETELYPMSMALLRHCFKKDLIPVVMTHWPDGVGMCKKACEEATAESQQLWGKETVSGKDFAFLGFKPGGGDLLFNMGENFKGAFPKDYYDQPTADMAALKGVDSLRDIDLAIDLAAGATVRMWIAYGSDRFDFPLGVGATAVIAPKLYHFLQSKQLVGFLGGLRGAADYEIMLDYDELFETPGVATRGMQAQSVTHVLLIILIVAANARFIANRLGGRQEV